jgi:hypothetical protein
VLGDVRLDELHQFVGHVLALGGRRRLKCVMQLDGNIQIHAFHFLSCNGSDLTHPLSLEVSLSGYEYGALLDAPGLPAHRDDPCHRRPVDIEGRGYELELLASCREPCPGLHREPVPGIDAGQLSRILDGKPRFPATALDEPAEHPCPNTLEVLVLFIGWKKCKCHTHVLITPNRRTSQVRLGFNCTVSMCPVRVYPKTCCHRPSWMPGDDYYTNFRVGDPYIKVDQGFARLPGAGYAALHPELKDVDPEDYPDINKMAILADVAPYSREYNTYRLKVGKQAQGNTELQIEYEKILDRVRQTKESVVRMTDRHFTAPVDEIEGTPGLSVLPDNKKPAHARAMVAGFPDLERCALNPPEPPKLASLSWSAGAIKKSGIPEGA